MPADVSPDVVLQQLVDTVRTVLNTQLQGLYLYGSYVTGDFEPARSDLDLLAVLDAEPTTQLCDRLAGAHEQIAAEHPAWRGRIEVEYVPLPGLFDPDGDHLMLRISPGERLHRVRTSRHYLLNWYTARHAGRALAGPLPSELLPDFTRAAFLSVVADHARQWPTWVEQMDTPGSQAYAVLTVCRAACAMRDGHQVSKRAAADACVDAMPEWRDLIGWARRWWYEGGCDDEPDRLPEVGRLVRHVSARISGQAPAS